MSKEYFDEERIKFITKQINKNVSGVKIDYVVANRGILFKMGNKIVFNCPNALSELSDTTIINTILLQLEEFYCVNVNYIW